jgi:hypothetical protein
MRKDDREEELRSSFVDDEGERSTIGKVPQFSKDDPLQQISSTYSVFSTRASASQFPKVGRDGLTARGEAVDCGPSSGAEETDTIMEDSLEDPIGWNQKAVSPDQLKPSPAMVGGVWDPFGTYPSNLPESLIAKCNHYCWFPFSLPLGINLPFRIEGGVCCD